MPLGDAKTTKMTKTVDDKTQKSSEATLHDFDENVELFTSI